MEKKQTVIKIVAVISVVAVISLFIVLSTKKTTGANAGGTSVDKPITTPNEPEKPKKHYTVFPKPSCHYKTNSKLNNIGGTANEKLLNTFIVGNEIILLIETSSNGYDFNAEEKSYALAVLDDDLNLLETKVLCQASEKYLTSTIFGSGIFLLTTSGETTTARLFNERYELEKSTNIEGLDNVIINQSVDAIKLLGYKNGKLFFSLIDDELNVTNSLTINTASEGFFDKTFSYDKKDIFINKRNGFFDIYKLVQTYDNDKIYYLIERICTIKGVIRQILPRNAGQNLLINFTDNSKTFILNFSPKDENYSVSELSLITDNSLIIPQNSGYLLHDYVTCSISILDENFRVIVSGLNKTNQYSVVQGQINFVDNSYNFVSKSLSENKTEIATINYELKASSILKIPYVNSPITIKKIKDVTYVFLSTNNNQEDFSSCYGGSDVFAIKLDEITVS